MSSMKLKENCFTSRKLFYLKNFGGGVEISSNTQIRALACHQLEKLFGHRIRASERSLKIWELRLCCASNKKSQ